MKTHLVRPGSEYAICGRRAALHVATDREFLGLLRNDMCRSCSGRVHRPIEGQPTPQSIIEERAEGERFADSLIAHLKEKRAPQSVTIEHRGVAFTVTRIKGKWYAEFPAHPEYLIGSDATRNDAVIGAKAEIDYQLAQSRCELRATDDVVRGPIMDRRSDALPVPAKRPFFNWRKVGGLRHWRIGRLGGSFYLARNEQ